MDFWEQLPKNDNNKERSGCKKLKNEQAQYIGKYIYDKHPLDGEKLFGWCVHRVRTEKNN